MAKNVDNVKALTPSAIAQALFGLQPDRDERASQIFAETLLTLVNNGYSPPVGPPTSPKRAQYALRSLILKVNFLANVAFPEPASVNGASQYGQSLADGLDFANSEHLPLLQNALSGLIDPQTRRGQEGVWLAYPFHESLLWYDARPQKNARWDIRKVLMRGSGITLARFLLDFPNNEWQNKQGLALVDALREALTEDSQIGEIAEHLAAPIRDLPESYLLQPDEYEAWCLAENELLANFGQRLIRHASSIIFDKSMASTTRLWSIRNVVAYDIAAHMMERAWDVLSVPVRERYTLFSVGGPARESNPVRQQSERSFQRAQRYLDESIVSTLSQRIVELAGKKPKNVDWNAQFEERSKLSELADELKRSASSEAYDNIARRIFENADYSRPRQGFRVLMESLSLVQSTGRYRFLSPGPDVLRFMVSCLVTQGPITGREFYEAAFKEWKIIIGPEMAAETSLLDHIDAAELARNARRVERLLVDSGLAISLSDSTTLIGGINV